MVILLERAEATARRAVALAPDDARARFALGSLLLRLEFAKIDPEGVPCNVVPDRLRVEEARDCFTKVIELSVRHGVAGVQAAWGKLAVARAPSGVHEPPDPRWLDDVPERAEAEIWPGLARFADRLAVIVRELPASSPILVSGDWGAGKTTLLCALQRVLSGDQDPATAAQRRAAAIWFDAWRYEGDEALLPALMRIVWEATPQDYRDVP